jgi:dTMP kinase
LSAVSRERPPFVVFEGGEGSGKSTQIARLAAWLRGRGVAVTVARDPGSTRVGQAVRTVLLDPGSQPMDGRTELLLYAAARAQLVRETLEPALAAGRVVLLDRYEDSTWAYQGGGRGPTSWCCSTWRPRWGCAGPAPRAARPTAWKARTRPSTRGCARSTAPARRPTLDAGWSWTAAARPTTWSTTSGAA